MRGNIIEKTFQQLLLKCGKCSKFAGYDNNYSTHRILDDV